MNRPEPINFITRPDLLSENASDMQLLFAFKSIVMDYARLSDPLEKRQLVSLLFMQKKLCLLIMRKSIKTLCLLRTSSIINMPQIFLKICLILCRTLLLSNFNTRKWKLLLKNYCNADFTHPIMKYLYYRRTYTCSERLYAKLVSDSWLYMPFSKRIT